MRARPANSEVPLFRLGTVLLVTDSQGSSSRSGQVASSSSTLAHTCMGPQEAVQVPKCAGGGRASKVNRTTCPLHLTRSAMPEDASRRVHFVYPGRTADWLSRRSTSFQLAHELRSTSAHPSQRPARLAFSATKYLSAIAPLATVNLRQVACPAFAQIATCCRGWLSLTRPKAFNTRAKKSQLCKSSWETKSWTRTKPPLSRGCLARGGNGLLSKSIL